MPKKFLIAVDERTHDRIRELSGDLPMAQWLRQLTKELELKQVLEFKADILKALVVKLKSYMVVDDDIWEKEYRDLLFFVLPACLAIQMGKQKMDADVWNEAIRTVIDEFPPDFPQPFRQDIIGLFQAARDGEC